MSVAISTLSADAQATLAFLTGVGPAGTLIQQNSGWSWDPDIAGTPVYDTGWSHKWGGGPAGSAGSAVFGFDSASNFTAGEQGIITGALALWAAESGVSFTQTADPGDATLMFYRFGSPNDPGSSGGIYTTYEAPDGAVGDAGVPATTSSYVSLDTSQPYWSELNSFTDFGGYGVDTVVHELGHVLGLYHAGPYNGVVSPTTQQFDSTDSRQWSVMSYIDPWSPAKFASEYAYPHAYWGVSAGGFAREPTTPMPLDILAAQRLYGLPTNSPLSGGQVFGFNCNIGGAIRPFFDFTVNRTPVVTLWDEGTGNVLDLSGFALAATVDLRPGTFSSTSGMTDNLGIAYGTRIDSLVGPAGGMAVTLNDDNDTVQGTGGANVAVLAAANARFFVGATGTQSFWVQTPTGATDLLLGVQGLRVTGGSDTVIGAGAGTFDLQGGGNLLFLGDRPVSVQSAGGDTIIAPGQSMTVAATGTVGSLIFSTGAALTVTSGTGRNTVVSGQAGAVVHGGAGGAFVWANGPVTYSGGTGPATVAAGATGSATVTAAGGGLFVGGGAGHNLLVASGGNATLIGGGNGDLLRAQNGANTLMVAGAGAETMSAVAAAGRNVFFAGTGPADMVGGSGQNIFVAGSGDATVNAGVGPGFLEVAAGAAGGTITVDRWDPTHDLIGLFGYAPDAVAQAVAGAVLDPAGGTAIMLSDHTRIVFADLTGISSNWFV